MIDPVQAGIVAARQGQRHEARELFQKALRENLQNEQAWLWMSTVVDSADEKQVCLERALSINPKNQGARAELEKIAATTVRHEFALKPLSRLDSPVNGGRAALPAGGPIMGGGNSVIQPLPVPGEDQPRRAVAADFFSSPSLPLQFPPEENLPPWVAASETAYARPSAEETPFAALALSGCLSITAVSGLLALGVLWLLGW